MRFKGKSALVTGSGRGIGRAIAVKLASEGADVVINFFRNRKPAEETAALCEAFGVATQLVKADVGDLEALEGMFKEIEARFGGLDILVNNAASGYIRPIEQQKPKGWDWTMNINARAHLFAAQHALPLMQKRGGGVIIGLSSLGSTFTLPEYVVIGVSKAAVETLTRYLAVEFARYNIRANAVSGGVVETEALQHFENGPAMIESARQRTPAGKVVTPEDMANVVAFLCSDEADMIRGQTIVVDGGYSLALGAVVHTE
ncbi:MAG: enoyl-[acyl-carrier-protein] reductase FabL [Ardenticatenales bacterium]|nr:enoyl-[acyl-carrier-protein] reductase FabL [Ardenticatenales bacterium]